MTLSENLKVDLSLLTKNNGVFGVEQSANLRRDLHQFCCPAGIFLKQNFLLILLSLIPNLCKDFLKLCRLKKLQFFALILHHYHRIWAGIIQSFAKFFKKLLLGSTDVSEELKFYWNWRNFFLQTFALDLQRFLKFFALKFYYYFTYPQISVNIFHTFALLAEFFLNSSF